jgi:pyruvate ferredoxin oxidoreductase delta subunit
VTKEKTAEKRWDYSDIKTWDWSKHPKGACIPAGGNSMDYSVAGWRTEHPEWDPQKCNSCMTCFIYCPDSAIQVDPETGKMTGIDYEHCKGCGICCRECLKEALKMVPEGSDE